MSVNVKTTQVTRNSTLSLLDSQHKGPIMEKVLLRHDVIMVCLNQTPVEPMGNLILHNLVGINVIGFVSGFSPSGYQQYCTPFLYQTPLSAS